MQFVLSRRAAADYITVYESGLERFGLRQAEVYLDRLDAMLALIAEQPGIGRVRTELSGSPRAHAFGAHVILWDVLPDGTIKILRIRHQREDWQG